MILKLCRGGCGTDLLDPQAPKSLFGACLSCLASAPKVNAQQAWSHLTESKRAKGLALVGRYETTEEGWRVIEDHPAETMAEQERYV